jgi:hypothetical protein
MLKILPHQAVPSWLNNYMPGENIPFKELFNNSVYYPACGFDGDVANLCMGYSHSFVYVDNLCLWSNTTKETVYSQINHPENFKGFKKIYQQEYSYEQLLGTHEVIHEPLQRNDGNPEHGLEAQPFFAILTIFEPIEGISTKYIRSETSTIHHVYERMAFLYICDDGCRAYEKIYQSHLTSPKAIAIIQPGDAFGGNWTSYYDQKQIFSRIVHRNPGGMPEIMIFGGRDSRGGWYRKNFWSSYPKNLYYSRLHNNALSVWK